MGQVQGIDVGAWRVRVATMEGSRRRRVLRDVVEMDASVGIAAAIKAIQAGEPGWDNAQRAAGFPLDRGAVRTVRLPFTDRTTINRALPAEVESNVPYDLEEMVLASRLIPHDKASQDKTGSRTLAVIAPKAEVRERLALLAGAGAEPKVMGMDAEALASYADRGVQAIIDVGHERIVMALCQEGQLIAARLIPMGGAALTEAIALALKLTGAEAEALKHELVLPGTEGAGHPDHAAAVLALLPALDEQLAEVRARLVAFEDEWVVGVDELLLAGGGSQLHGLAGRLSSLTGLPCRSVIVPGGHPAGCALAVALARVAADEVPVTDLRIGEFAYRGHADILWNVVSYGGFATVAALFMGALVLGVRVFQTWDDMDELDTRIVDSVARNVPGIDPARLADTSMALAILQEKSDAMQARVDSLGSIVGGEPPTLGTLRRLSATLPQNNVAKIDVRELTLTAEALSFKAETASYESAAKIEEALKASDDFAQARKGDEKKSGEVLLFNMSIPLGAPVAPTDAAASVYDGKEG